MSTETGMSLQELFKRGEITKIDKDAAEERRDAIRRYGHKIVDACIDASKEEDPSKRKELMNAIKEKIGQ